MFRMFWNIGKSSNVLTHHQEVDYTNIILSESWIPSEICGVEDWVCDNFWHVGAIFHPPNLKSVVACLELKELDKIVEDGEDDDGDDVTESWRHLWKEKIIIEKRLLWL